MPAQKRACGNFPRRTSGEGVAGMLAEYRGRDGTESYAPGQAQRDQRATAVSRQRCAEGEHSR